MLLWIIRHGKAEPSHALSDDWTRRLTPRGERQARWLGESLSARPDAPGILLASPVTRAAQTARLVAEVLHKPVKWASELETERPVDLAIELIASVANASALAMFGHNFQLSELLVELCRGRLTEGDLSELRTGEAALVELNADSPVGSGALLARLRLSEED